MTISQSWDYLIAKTFSLNEYFESKITKCFKIVGLMKRLSNKLPRDVLLKIYKSFVRSHLDYGDIMYDKTQEWVLHKQVRKNAV